ncbi:MAG: hypothetical protein ACYCYM_05665 [Saccharofermentanales bacterium]
MKKLAVLVLAVCLLLSAYPVNALDLNDWINVGNTELGNCVITQNGDGVTFTGAGEYPAKSLGVVYDKPVNPSDVSMKFTIDKMGPSDGSTWIALVIGTKKAYVDIGNPTVTEGLVFLMIPAEGGAIHPQLHSLMDDGVGFGNHLSNWFFDTQYGKFQDGHTVTFEMKADAVSGYAIYLNGVRVKNPAAGSEDVDLNYLKTLFAETADTAYISLSASDPSGTAMQYTVSEINGESAITPAAPAGWTNVSKITDGNCTVTSSGTGVSFEGTGEYGMKNFGIIYNTPINPSDVQMDFTLDKIGSTDGTSWISIAIVTKLAYMDVGNPTITEGLVFLMIPTDTGYLHPQLISLLDDGVGFANHISNWFFDTQYGKFENGSKMSFEMKEDAVTGYAVYLNGIRVRNPALGSPEVDLNYLKPLFEANNNQAYIMLSATDPNSADMKYTINEIKLASAVEATPSPTLAPTTAPTAALTPDAESDDPDTNPETGDTHGLVILAVMLSLGFVAAASKKKLSRQC